VDIDLGLNPKANTVLISFDEAEKLGISKYVSDTAQCMLEF
jgi:hypothetical protein